MGTFRFLRGSNSHTMSDEGKFKWKVNKGGSYGHGALNVKHNTDNANVTFNQHGRYGMDFGGESSYGLDSVETQTKISVPDARFTQREFEMGAGGSQYGPDAVQVNTAVNAPKPPTTVDNINSMDIRHSGACDQ